MKKLVALFSAFAPLLVANIAKAQDLPSSSLTPEQTTDIANATTGGLMGLFAASLAILAIVGIVGLIFLVLWIWALVDVLGRTFPDEGTKKTWKWLVILSWPLPVVLGFIPGVNILSPVLGLAGAIVVIIYLVSIRKKGTKKGAQSTPSPVEKK